MQVRTSWALLWLVFAACAYAQDMEIRAFDGKGLLSFSAVSNAQSYRVECAPSPTGPWTDAGSSFDAADPALAVKKGVVTVNVQVDQPQNFRRVTAVLSPLAAAPPVINNDAGASNVLFSTATLNAYMGSTGGAPTFVWVYWGTNDGVKSAAAWGVSNAFGKRAKGMLSTNVTGLLPGKQYYFRFYATNSAGKVWAPTSANFTTLAPLPPAIDNDGGASNVTYIMATINGRLSSAGNTPTYAWVFSGTNDGGTNAVAWETIGAFGLSTVGPLSTNLMGLLPSTRYYYRFYATNSAGRVWAPSSTNFTTLPGKSSNLPLLAGGGFQMGDALGDALTSDEKPVHTVTLSPFYIDPYPVTKAVWDSVYTWALTNGYSFSAPNTTNDIGTAVGAAHPVLSVGWYDAVKWCNARSEKDQRVPAYYSSSSRASSGVLRTGEPTGIAETWVRWNTGYRLPTEAEWEYAARGGAVGRRFPWSDANTIAHGRANYFSTTRDAYDQSSTRGYHPAYSSGDEPYTSPVGAFSANGFGLYDMCGNVWEWCWDLYGTAYYAASPAVNPHGPDSGSGRVLRGGAWAYTAYNCRVARRDYYNADYTGRSTDVGFRCVLPK